MSKVAESKAPMIRILLAGAAVCATCLLLGCNTVGGVGEDLKAAGGAIKETAQKTKDKISK